MPTELMKLKKQLNEELQKENSDNDLILSLSYQIAQLDEKQVRFSVDAGIINRLGKELVGRHETAVSELVKNAYDADATEVKLVFEDAEKSGGTLYIEDDGAGMQREQLINGFMRLSSADKIHNPVSPKYNRTRAGRKGIGRFATQRLGKALTIITQTKDSDQAIKIQIDWEKFETDRELSFIANEIVTLHKEREEGTTLIIEDLNEAWSDTAIKRSYRYTADLLQPFPLSEEKKKQDKNGLDPGFRSSYFRRRENEDIVIADDEEEFFKHALAEIEGYVMKDGQAFWAMQSDKLSFSQELFPISKSREDKKSRYQYLNGVHFKCYYFIYEPSLVPAGLLSFLRNMGHEKGGVRLYRNGFRVLPYGEKGDDWLGFDESVRRRIILPAHGNNNLFGFVEVTDIDGTSFEETSSREGLVENDALRELKDFIYRSIMGAVAKISEIRGRKGRTAQKGWTKQSGGDESEVDDAIEELEDFIRGDDSEGASKPGRENRERRAALERLKAGREKEKQAIKELIEENNMLRVLAGLGLVIGEFVHEITRFLPAFDVDIKYLRQAVVDIKEALIRVDRLESNLKGFETYTSYFYNSVSKNVLRELKEIELRDVVHGFQKVISNEIERSGFTFHDPVFEDYDLWTVPMHESEWASILFNFYMNSKKAIRRAGTKGEIAIRAGKDSGSVFLEFSDNGDGISPENEDKIFDAFFTTTSAAGHDASDQDALLGVGLGLKIVRDIVESYGGEIYVATPAKGFATTIRIEIPEGQGMEEA